MRGDTGSVCIDGWRGGRPGMLRVEMLRVPLSLAVVLSALFAFTAVAEAAETWQPADKQAFGTAHDVRSKVWFTLGPTGMREAYWPRTARPAVRSSARKVAARSQAALGTGGVPPADP